MNKTFKNKKEFNMVISNYEDAFFIGSQYINKKREINEIYEMSIESLKNSLKYIIEYLNHNCYMLCVKNNIKKMYKLETKRSSLYAYNIIKQYKLNNNNICSIIKKPFRMMGCIIKPYSDSFNEEYKEYFKYIFLKDGVYILNVNDSSIISMDLDPFELLPIENRKKINNIKFLPTISLSKKINHYDILIPNFDDIEEVFNLQKRDMMNKCNKIWNTKKNKAVFRGGPTGCGLYPTTNQRLELSLLKNKNIDAGIVLNKGLINLPVKSNSVKIDPKFGIGQLYQPQIKTVGFMTMIEQSNYKYIIHIDGNVGAYRLLTSMLTSSLILRVKTEYILWCDNYIKPYKHYIPVNKISELPIVIEWCKNNNDECMRIAKSGFEIATELLTFDKITNIFQ